MDTKDLSLLVEHLAWADGRLLECLRRVPEPLWQQPVPSSYGSLLATVHHLYAAEWTWLERISGRSPTQVGPPGGVGDPTRLAEQWPPVWEGWRQAVRTLAPEATIRYRTTAGRAQVASFGQVVLHLTHHSATYRGQVTALARLLGLPAVGGDLMAYLREREGA